MLAPILRKIYSSLPVIRELRGLKQALKQTQESQLHYLLGVERRMKTIETASSIVAVQMLREGDARYTDPSRLLAFGRQYWSQSYEDGMIEEVLRRVPPTTKSFLEIGVQRGAENNTTALLAQGWRGWWIECDRNHCASIRQSLVSMPRLAEKLHLHETYVSPSNIGEILNKLGVPSEVDIFSLDIDQDTYHVWAALADFRPRVVVVEYNSGISPSVHWVHPYKEGRVWDGTQAFGASLKAFEMLGRELGYSLVGCDIVGVNAFFVRDDLVGDKFAPPYTAENHYEPPRYGLSTRWGHPSKFFGESQSNGLKSCGSTSRSSARSLSLDPNTNNSSLKELLENQKLASVKLHLGCGGVRWQDFINVDLHPQDPSVRDSSRNGCVADVFADIRNLGLSDNTIDEIFTSHTIDHFTRWQAIDMLKDWHRMVKPKGRLVIEAADFNRCLLWLFHPSRKKREAARTQFYGNQWDGIEFETHRYLWSARELSEVLRNIGFRQVSYSHAALTHYPGRDMRMTALK